MKATVKDTQRCALQGGRGLCSLELHQIGMRFCTRCSVEPLHPHVRRLGASILVSFSQKGRGLFPRKLHHRVLGCIFVRGAQLNHCIRVCVGWVQTHFVSYHKAAQQMMDHAAKPWLTEQACSSSKHPTVQCGGWADCRPAHIRASVTAEV